jgi:hypothetical protein
MIDHIVLYRLKPDIAPAELGLVARLVHALTDQVGGIVSVTSGRNTGPMAYQQGYSWGFVMRFADEAARDGYFEHPAHLAIIPSVEAVTSDVLVFDLEVGD